MGNRVKYPLTDGAKQAARWLVEAWEKNEIEQRFRFTEHYSDWRLEHTSAYSRSNVKPFEPPPGNAMLELAQYKLIQMTELEKRDHWEVLLLQEIRDAVQSDFEVSDFFLTTMAVGTIIQGNLTIHPNANYQSAASISGDIIQTVGQLADQLTETLGESLLESNAEIKAAIDELRAADVSNKISRVGSVIEVLGRALGHVGSAASIIAAIQMLAQFLR